MVPVVEPVLFVDPGNDALDPDDAKPLLPCSPILASNPIVEDEADPEEEDMPVLAILGDPGAADARCKWCWSVLLTSALMLLGDLCPPAQGRFAPDRTFCRMLFSSNRWCSSAERERRWGICDVRLPTAIKNWDTEGAELDVEMWIVSGDSSSSISFIEGESGGGSVVSSEACWSSVAGILLAKSPKVDPSSMPSSLDRVLSCFGDMGDVSEYRGWSSKLESPPNRPSLSPRSSSRPRELPPGANPSHMPGSRSGSSSES